MKESKVHDFWKEREALNEIMMEHAGLGTKRFLSLDSQAYRKGALDKKTKEMLGLVASMVLRCDDCIYYHMVRCHQEGMTEKELEEVLNIGLVVGGSITIPHLRRAYKAWEDLQKAPIKGE
jgi:AhpD family alkylhydroperoxidase